MPKRKAAATVGTVSEPVKAKGKAKSGSEANKPSKKRQRAEPDYEGPVNEPSASSDDSDSSSGDSDSGDEDGEIELDGQLTGAETGTDDAGGIMQINFDFCDPDERFFHGIKALLTSFLPPKANVASSELADLVIAQGAVGTIVVQEGADDAFAFITALPLQFHKEKPVIQAFAKYLLSVAGEHKAALSAVLAESTCTGLLLHEQLLNLPIQIKPRLHDALRDDVAWALEHEISQEHKDKFKFKSYIIVAPCEVAAGGGSSSALTTRDMYFLKFDDEVFVNAAEFYFVVRMPDASSNEGKARPQQCRVIASITAAKYAACLAEVESMAVGT